MFVVCNILLVVVVVVKCVVGHENETVLVDADQRFTFEVNLNATPEFELNFPANYNITNTNFDDIQLQHSERYEHLRRRKKEEAIIIIRARIMATLGQGSRSNISNNVISEDERNRIVLRFERLRTQMQNNDLKGTEEVYAEKVQSFYPSCSLPRNTDAEVWENDDSFHLYYDINTPRNAQGSTINVSSAKLRLYKNGNGIESYNPGDTSWTAEQPNSNYFKITVFQYLKPLRRNRRPKKKQLDSKEISVYEEGWIEFNIESSITDWFENTNKNFGLLIVLQDENDVAQNPSYYIHKMNCSEHKTNDPPFPRFMEDESVREENNSSIFDNETYPTLDLRTIEFPGEIMQVDENESEIRTRRHAINEVPNGECSLETSYISFRELGWDEWIINPEGFNIHYCIGTCRSESDIDEFDDNELQHYKDKSCIPSEYDSVKLSYVDDNEIVHNEEIYDLVIKSCVCSAVG